MDGFISGAIAGSVATVTMHPLDLAKVRLQLGRSASLFGSLREVARGPGFELYRGLLPNLVGNAAAWGSYFWLYEKMQDVAFGPALALPRSSSAYLLCSLSAGLLAQFATNPIWVLKTRILGSKRGDPGASRSLWLNTAQIWRTYGLRGFWRGFVPGTLGTLQSALYFAIYAPLKPWLQRELGLRDTANYFTASAIAKSIAATLMYPHQVVRARMQFEEVGIWQSVAEVWAHERWRGFYRGLSANLARVVPAMAITLVTYEEARKIVPQYTRPGEELK